MRLLPMYWYWCVLKTEASGQKSVDNLVQTVSLLGEMTLHRLLG